MSDTLQAVSEIGVALTDSNPGNLEIATARTLKRTLFFCEFVHAERKRSFEGQQMAERVPEMAMSIFWRVDGLLGAVSSLAGSALQGYLTHTKQPPPPRTTI